MDNLHEDLEWLPEPQSIPIKTRFSAEYDHKHMSWVLLVASCDSVVQQGLSEDMKQTSYTETGLAQTSESVQEINLLHKYDPMSLDQELYSPSWGDHECVCGSPLKTLEEKFGVIKVIYYYHFDISYLWKSPDHHVLPMDK